MTLEQKIKLIDDLIAEDSDHNIRDYLDILEEVENIENENQTDMGQPWMTPEQKETVLRLAQSKSPKEIETETGLTLSAIYRLLNNQEVDFRKLAMKRRQERKRQEEAARIAGIGARQVAVRVFAETDKRPKAEYSNTGFLSVKQKYAV